MSGRGIDQEDLCGTAALMEDKSFDDHSYGGY